MSFNISDSQFLFKLVDGKDIVLDENG